MTCDNNIAAGISLSVFPNPAIDYLTIAYSSEGLPVLQVIRGDGVRMLELRPTGVRDVVLDVSDWVARVYYVIVGDGRVVWRWVKMR